MTDEFVKDGPGIVRSSNGFTVTTKFGGGVLYEDKTGAYTIDSEWKGSENGIILYRPSPTNKGTARLGEDEIFTRVIRALKAQGYSVEVA